MRPGVLVRRRGRYSFTTSIIHPHTLAPRRCSLASVVRNYRYTRIVNEDVIGTQTVEIQQRNFSATSHFRDDGGYQPLPRKELSDPRQLVALLKTEVKSSKEPPHKVVLSRFQQYKDTELFNPIVVAASFNYMVKGQNRQAATEDPRFFELTDFTQDLMHRAPDEFPPRASSLILHAVGRIVPKPTDRVSGLMVKGADLIVSSIAHSPGKVDPRAVVNALYAFGQWYWAYKPLFESCADFLMPRLHQLTPQGLVLALYAYGRARYAHADFFDAVTRHAASLLQDCSAQGLALLLWSFARTGQRPDALFAWQIANEAMSRLGEFQAISLANLTWSSARLGIHYGSFFQAIAQRTATLVKYMRARELSTLALAFASVRHTGVDSDTAIQLLLSQAALLKNQTKPLDFASILTAASLTEKPDLQLCSILLYQLTDVGSQKNLSTLVDRWKDSAESTLNRMPEDDSETAGMDVLAERAQTIRRTVIQAHDEDVGQRKLAEDSGVNDGRLIGTKGTAISGVGEVTGAHDLFYRPASEDQTSVDTFLRSCRSKHFVQGRGVAFFSRAHELAALFYSSARLRLFAPVSEIQKWSDGIGHIKADQPLGDYLLHPSRIRMPYFDALVRSTYCRLPDSLQFRERASVMHPSIHVTRLAYGIAEGALFRDSLARGDTYDFPTEMRSGSIQGSVYRGKAPVWVSAKERDIIVELAWHIRDFVDRDMSAESSEAGGEPNDRINGIHDLYDTDLAPVAPAWSQEDLPTSDKEDIPVSSSDSEVFANESDIDRPGWKDDDSVSGDVPLADIRPGVSNKSNESGAHLFGAAQALTLLYSMAACGIWDETVFSSLWPLVQANLRKTADDIIVVRCDSQPKGNTNPHTTRQDLVAISSDGEIKSTGYSHRPSEGVQSPAHNRVSLKLSATGYNLTEAMHSMGVPLGERSGDTPKVRSYVSPRKKRYYSSSISCASDDKRDNDSDDDLGNAFMGWTMSPKKGNNMGSVSRHVPSKDPESNLTAQKNPYSDFRRTYDPGQHASTLELLFHATPSNEDASVSSDPVMTEEYEDDKSSTQMDSVESLDTNTFVFEHAREDLALISSPLESDEVMLARLRRWIKDDSPFPQFFEDMEKSDVYGTGDEWRQSEAGIHGGTMPMDQEGEHFNFLSKEVQLRLDEIHRNDTVIQRNVHSADLGLPAFKRRKSM